MSLLRAYSRRSCYSTQKRRVRIIVLSRKQRLRFGVKRPSTKAQERDFIRAIGKSIRLIVRLRNGYGFSWFFFYRYADHYVVFNRRNKLPLQRFCFFFDGFCFTPTGFLNEFRD